MLKKQISMEKTTCRYHIIHSCESMPSWAPRCETCHFGIRCAREDVDGVPAGDG